MNVLFEHFITPKNIQMKFKLRLMQQLDGGNLKDNILYDLHWLKEYKLEFMARESSAQNFSL